MSVFKYTQSILFCLFLIRYLLMEYNQRVYSMTALIDWAKYLTFFKLIPETDILPVFNK